MKKMHNTAETSKESFKKVLRSGQIKREKDRVIDCLQEYQPMTARSVSDKTGIEKTNITRSLYDLVKAGLIKVSFTDKCSITNHIVGYYTLIDWVSESGQSQAA